MRETVGFSSVGLSMRLTRKCVSSPGVLICSNSFPTHKTDSRVGVSAANSTSDDEHCLGCYRTCPVRICVDSMQTNRRKPITGTFRTSNGCLYSQVVDSLFLLLLSIADCITGGNSYTTHPHPPLPPV